jgi:hypothetical protein
MVPYGLTIPMTSPGVLAQHKEKNMGTFNFKIFFFISALGVLSACGGSSGESSPSVSNGLEGNLFLPADQTAEWTYNNGSLTTSYRSPRILRSDSIDSLAYSTGGKEYFFTESDIIAWRGFYSPEVIASGVGTFTADVVFDSNLPLYVEGETAGSSHSFSASGTVNIQPTYGNQSASITGYSEFVGFENITVPYGVYTHVLHIAVNASISVDIQGYTVDVPRVFDLWLAEDIGIIRYSEAGQTFELTGFVG